MHFSCVLLYDQSTGLRFAARETDKECAPWPQASKQVGEEEEEGSKNENEIKLKLLIYGFTTKGPLSS